MRIISVGPDNGKLPSLQTQRNYIVTINVARKGANQRRYGFSKRVSTGQIRKFLFQMQPSLNYASFWQHRLPCLSKFTCPAEFLTHDNSVLHARNLLNPVKNREFRAELLGTTSAPSNNWLVPGSSCEWCCYSRTSWPVGLRPPPR
jgi:hypothetical protein